MSLNLNYRIKQQLNTNLLNSLEIEDLAELCRDEYLCTLVVSSRDGADRQLGRICRNNLVDALRKKERYFKYCDESRYISGSVSFSSTTHQELMSDMKVLLNQSEYNLLNLLLYGYTQAEISNQLSITQQAVSKRLNSIKNKVQYYFTEV